MVRARLFPLALAIAACRPASAPPRTAPLAADPCLIAPSSPSLADTVIIAAEGLLDQTFARQWRLPTEKVAFAQEFETLVRVTCDGRLVPALADGWTGDSAGRRWTLTIRPDATFGDGTPVTAYDVALAWERQQDALGASAVPGGAVLEHVIIEADRAITVHLRDAHRDGPRLLADRSFVVLRRDIHSNVPIGTGTYSLTPSAREPGSRTNVEPGTAILMPRLPGTAPVLVLRAVRSGDARDLIDQGVDVLVTSDRRVTEYATARRDLQARPLPPDRAYVLLSAARSANAAPFRISDDDSRLAALRASLSLDVIRSALPSEPDRWWGASDGVAMCSVVGPSSAPAWTASPASARPPRVVYPADDRIAGELARRLVALATFDRGASTESAGLGELVPELLGTSARSLVATGLSETDLTVSLMRGADLAYLLALPRRALDPCAAWRHFTARAPWVTVDLPARLAETGPTLITSARAPALTIEWDNTVRVVERNAPPRDRR